MVYLQNCIVFFANNARNNSVGQLLSVSKKIANIFAHGKASTWCLFTSQFRVCHTQ